MRMRGEKLQVEEVNTTVEAMVSGLEDCCL